MLRRAATCIALLLAVAAAFGQDDQTVRITFPTQTERQIWFGAPGDFSEPTNPVSSIAIGVQLDIPDEAMSKWIFVHTLATGDVAVRKVEEALEDGVWVIAEEEFDHQYVMEIRLEHDGRAVASAVVELSAAGKQATSLVSASDEGQANFYAIPFGEVELSVQYNSEGENRSMPTQILSAKAASASSSVYLIQITDPVETVGAEGAAAEPEAASEEEEKTGTSIFYQIMKMLIGLAVVAAIGYFIIQYLKKNSDQAQEGLAKLGISVPGSGGDPAAAAPVAPARPKQIVLGGGAAPVPDATAAPAAPAVKNPRLVKADGSILMVPEGEQTVGRDDTADIVVEGESSVSRKHASLTREGDAVTINDLGSSNGTYVNGTRISAQQTLKPGDTVQFGGAQYRYEE